MNIVKLQDIKLIHRNPLHSYTLTMRKQVEIKQTIPFTIANEKNKILRKTWNSQSNLEKEEWNWNNQPA